MQPRLPFALNRISAPLGLQNAVLRARARTHFVKEFPGPLSVKSVTEGRVAWKVAGRELVVDPDSFLVLQDAEPYSMEIDSRTPVGTLCVFFQNGFVESVHAALKSTEIERDLASTPLLARLHPADQRILPRMRALARAQSRDQLHLDQEFLAIATDLLLLDRDMRRRVSLMPARRFSTREELFRRVSRGRDFLHANSAADLDLAAIARAACLSPYHFHRAFTRAFGKTPHQYRNHLRLAQARRLLETTERPVAEIAATIGFESLASFSLLFRRSFGVSPSAIRKLRKIR
jgi:AraC family transcriptional regulator